jgi:hypothetical protein
MKTTREEPADLWNLRESMQTATTWPVEHEEVDVDGGDVAPAWLHPRIEREGGGPAG